jgi:hypothetical protein
LSQEAIVDVLAEGLGLMEKGLAQRLAVAEDPAVLRVLHRKSIKVESLDEFLRLLERRKSRRT